MTTYKSNPNVYQQITDRVIAAIEAGAPKFEMPWHHGSSHSRPVNVFTGKNYRGVNTVALWVAQMEYGYTTGTWGTYKQWKECGAQVLKGEHAATVVFFKDVERPVEDSEETKSKRSFVATASWVFNADQVEGYTASPVSPLVDKTQVLERVEAFITATDADIMEKGNCACYHPIKDTIYMPKRELFTGSSTSSATESYYSTLLHELTHWTGHPTRLKRDLKNRFGDFSYSMEELVAELGAAFLCADLGVSLEPRPDHAAYLQGWLKALKQDKRALFVAASKASEATDYLFKLQPQPLEQAA